MFGPFLSDQNKMMKNKIESENDLMLLFLFFLLLLLFR